MRQNDYYSYLVENPIKKRTLLTLIFCSWISFTIFATESATKGHDWIQIGSTMTLLSSLYIFYPLIERWRYRPWQCKPTKVEYTFLK